MLLLAALLFTVFVAVSVGIVAWRKRRPKLRALAEARRPAESTASTTAHAPPPPLLVFERRRREAVVVFVHGFAGFTELRLGNARASYFRGVREHLQRRGVRIAFAQLPSVAPIAVRGAALARFLDELGDVDLHLIGHSMGGLDARWVARNASPSNLRSLVTVATPHRGTPLADLGAAVLGRPRRLAGLARSVADLTRAHPELHDDAPLAGLTCASVVVEPSRGTQGVRPILRPTHRLIEALAGRNDGIVPVSSQRWGEVLGTVDTDHCGVLGWGQKLDAGAFYGALAISLLDGAPSLEQWDSRRPRIATVEVLTEWQPT